MTFFSFSHVKIYESDGFSQILLYLCTQDYIKGESAYAEEEGRNAGGTTEKPDFGLHHRQALHLLQRAEIHQLQALS